MSECILWHKAIASTGYGQSWRNGKSVSAHRLAYEDTKGAIPEGMSVLHTCDVKQCVNPDHLYVGTAKDNARDAIERGQIATGDRHGTKTQPDSVVKGSRKPNAKLTEDQVREIREIYKPRPSLEEVAMRYGVSVSSISRIIRGESYIEALNKEQNQ